MAESQASELVRLFQLGGAVSSLVEVQVSSSLGRFAVVAGAFPSLQLHPHGLLKCGELGGGFIQHFQRASLCITDIPGCPIEFVECQNQ